MEDVANTGAMELSRPTATNKPEELTATLNITATALDPFMRAGVVQVEPLEEVANKGALGEFPSVPTATNRPDELTAIPGIIAAALDPFMRAGVVKLLAGAYGETLLLAALAADVPIAFVAVTVNV